MKKCSVVIASHNKHDYLRHTLACLVRQTYPCYEIILVDDTSDPPVRDVPDGVSLLRMEGTPNVSRARNRGIAEATGEVILLTDDDLLVREDWVACHMQHHQHTENNLILGAVKRIEYHGEPHFWELPFTTAARGEENMRKRLARLFPWKACGANTSVSKQKLIEAGLFCEEYQGWGVEDVDLSYRLWRLGLHYQLEPRAVAYHQQHPPQPRRTESERRNQWLFVRRHGFWPYGTPPPDFNGPVHGPTDTPAALAVLLRRWQQANALDDESRSPFHLFRAPDGRPFLFEARSGLFFELSELGFALMRLRLLSTERTEEEVSAIAGGFSASEVAECIDESYEALTFLSQNALPPPAKQRAGRDAPPLQTYTLSLHTSLKCNLACRYCFAASAREHASSPTMSRDTARRALDWFADFLIEKGAQGVIGFNLAAEPLVSWDLLMFVDDYRKQLERTRGISLLLSTITNGTLLTEEKARCLKERGIRISTLSVDGPPDIHDALRCFPNGRGSYQAVVKNLPHALQLFPNYDLRISDLRVARPLKR